MKLLPLYEGPSPEMATSSAYCLKWNNHRTNLLSAFNVLLQQEAFTDVTLACEDGQTLHAHRLVLAACSSYFSSLFSSANTIHTDKHPIVILRDIKSSDMKAILEYMYRGEVNIEREALPNLLRVADGLRIKGLIGELPTSDTSPLPLVSNSSYAEEPPHHHRHRRRDCASPKDEQHEEEDEAAPRNLVHRERKEYAPCASPYTANTPEKQREICNGGTYSTSPSPTSPMIQSPPPRHPLHHLPTLPTNSYFPPNFFSIMERREQHHQQQLRDSPIGDRSEMMSSRPSSVDYKMQHNLVPPLLTPLALPPPTNGLDSPPPKRPLNLMREPPLLPPTPILRTALAHQHGIRHDVLASLATSMLPIQTQLNVMAHARLSTSPMASSHSFMASEPLRREPDYHEHPDIDAHHPFVSQSLPFGLTHPKKEEPMSDDDSKSFSDGSKDSGEKEKISHPLAQKYSNYSTPDHNNSAHFSNFASYVPQTRPEWKRYKQYTKRDLQNAIDAVKSGMTALQASHKHKVPSRTLYDKIKKMGITTLPRRLPKRSTQMDVDSTSDTTPGAHLDVRHTPSADLFDQRPRSPRNALDHRRSPSAVVAEIDAAYRPARSSEEEEELERKRIADHMETGGATTARGSFSVVERKVIADANSLPLDLTDHTAIIPAARRQIEERA